MIARMLAIIGLLAPLAAGQVTIDLPLKGYYRLGGYMPISVSVASGQKILIEGDGYVPLYIDHGSGALNQVFPLLVLSAPSRTITVTVDGNKQTIELPFPLRERDGDERFVASIGNVPDAIIAEHFSAKRIVRIDLQPATMLTGPIEPWETLDAIFVDPLPKELNNQPEVFLRLAGQGVFVAIRSDSPLNTRYPFKHDGDWWTLQHEPIGPTSSLTPAAYAPVTQWSAEFIPAITRRQVVGDAVIVAILAIGATLLRPTRKALAALIGLTIVAMLLMGFWTADLETVKEARGAISVKCGSLLQTDNWLYHTTTRPQYCEWAMDQSGIARPLLIDADAARRIELRMRCYAGAPSLVYSMTLSPERKIVFLSRTIGPAWTDRQLRNEQTPMHALARDAYPGCRVLGDESTDEDEDAFGSLYLIRDTSTTKR